MQRWALQDGSRGPVKMQDGEQARKMGCSSSPTSIPGGSTQHPPCSHPPVLMQNQPSRGWAGLEARDTPEQNPTFPVMPFIGLGDTQALGG